VRRHDLHAERQRALQLVELRFDPLDDVERVLTVAGDDDGAHCFTDAVELNETPTNVGTDLDVAHVAHAHRDAAWTGLDGDLSELPDAFEIAAPADEVLASAHLEQPAARVAVGTTHAARDVVNRQPIGAQPRRIERDLVLLFITADARHLSHTGNG